MKVCCSSRSHSRMLGAGELTQLEWVDACANALMLDGVEFCAAHFPRTDDDYLAQLKKLCADRCLTVAGICADTAIGSADIDTDVDAISLLLDHALAIGAPLLRVRASPPPDMSPGAAWGEFIRALKNICVNAKRVNVTLALEPRDDSLVASAHDAKRAMKECDSAWLRLAITTRHLIQPAAGDWDELLGATVIVPATLSRPDGTDEAAQGRALAGLARARFRGFLSIEYGGGDSEAAAVARVTSWLRSALAANGPPL